MRATGAPPLFDARFSGLKANSGRAVDAGVIYFDLRSSKIGIDKGKVGREACAFAHLDDNGFIPCVNVGVDVERHRRLAPVLVNYHACGIGLQRVGERDFVILIAADDGKIEGNAGWRADALHNSNSELYHSGCLVHGRSRHEADPLVVCGNGYRVLPVHANTEARGQFCLINLEHDDLVLLDDIILKDIDIEGEIACSACGNGYECAAVSEVTF